MKSGVCTLRHVYRWLNLFVFIHKHEDDVPGLMMGVQERIEDGVQMNRVLNICNEIASRMENIVMIKYSNRVIFRRVQLFKLKQTVGRICRVSEFKTGGQCKIQIDRANVILVQLHEYTNNKKICCAYQLNVN
jgi:hypothetical protein